MERDPLIEEVREVRRKISAEFGHDPRRLVAHYAELEGAAQRAGRGKFRRAPFAPAVEKMALHDKPPQG